MKKISLIISLIVLMANGYAQEIETLMTKDRQSTTSYSGFGGPLLGATQINKELGLTIGGKGGVIVNKKFAFGGIGFGMVNSPEFTGNNLSGNTNAQLQMSYGAGGVFFEYIFNIQNLVHFSIPLNIMAGGINIYDYKAETEIESSAFFIIEPGINIWTCYIRSDSKLYLFVSGQPEYEMLATDKHKFSFKTLEGFKVEFVESDDKSINEIILIQPNGTFKATRK